MLNLSAHNGFLILATIFCMLFALITPPFQVPDEVSHLYRAYQISEGKFISIKENHRVGGYVPESLVSLADSYKKLPYNVFTKVNNEYIRDTKKIALQDEKTVFKDFPNTAYYSPVSYIPQSITIYILRLFNCKPYYLLYISRILTMAFWIVTVYLAIRMMPFQKWLLAFLALLPMSLFINSSISADVVTNGLSFLFIAYVLMLAFVRKIFTYKDFAYLSILIVLLASAKLLYVVLVILFLVIPISKFKSLRNYILVFSSLLILGFGSSILVKRNIDQIYTPYDEYNKEFIEYATIGHHADMTKQAEYIKHHKITTIENFLISFGNEFPYLAKSYVGILGWGDTPLPNWIVIINYFVIFLLAFLGLNGKKKLTNTQRLILVFVVVLATILIMLSQYLTWVPVGSNKVYPLQGRYFIPIVPLLFLVISNSKFSIPQKYLKMIFVISFLISGLFSANLLFARYYFNYELEEKWEIFRDVGSAINEEEIIMEETDTIAISNSVVGSDEMAYSGKYSVKLMPNDPYGLGHKIFNAQKGDRIVVSAWCHGKAGKIVFNELIENGIYHLASRVYKKSNSGWRYIESDFFVPKDMTGTELRIYVWNNSNQNVYFDDFKISYYCKKE